MSAIGGWLPAWLLMVVVDQIVAVIGGEVLTDSRFRLEARLALAWHQGEAAAQQPFSPKLRRILKRYVVDTWIVLAQAPQSLVSVTDEAINARLLSLIARFGDETAFNTFCSQFGWSRSEVRDVLQHHLLSEHLLQQRLQLATAANQKMPLTPDIRRTPLLRQWLIEWQERTEIHFFDDDLLVLPEAAAPTPIQ